MEDPEALKRASAGSCIGRWFPPFPLRSNAACHPERRRREGPAFGRARRASRQQNRRSRAVRERRSFAPAYAARRQNPLRTLRDSRSFARRSEEHTSELQSRVDLVCRLLLEKKKKQKLNQIILTFINK